MPWRSKRVTTIRTSRESSASSVWTPGMLLLGFPLALLSFTAIVTGVAVGLGALVILVGLPILVATVLVAQVFADIERLRFPAVLHRPRTRPAYRTAAPGASAFKPDGHAAGRRTVLAGPGSRRAAVSDLGGHLLRIDHLVDHGGGGTLTVAWDWAIPRGPDNTSLGPADRAR